MGTVTLPAGALVAKRTHYTLYKNMQTTITPTKHYTCYEIVKQGLIPGIRTIQQMTALARTDKLTNQYLDATITKRGDKGTQYQILGANIIKYLVNHE